MTSTSPCGLLIIDKPVGMTSRMTVDFVERPLRPVKVGHAGTLDPLAQGVMVLCVGAATRLIDYVHRLPKRYLATFRFGVSSPTLDLESVPVELPDAPRPTREQLEQALGAFRGTIQQRPPDFSAAWVQGKRAYELARRGDDVQLAARTITIHAISLTRYEYPEADFDVTCSTGTYIRSLGCDIATGLGTAAVMTSLERTSIGPFERTSALPAQRMSRDKILERLRSGAEALPDMPRHVATAVERDLIAHGRFVALDQPAGISELAAIDESGALLAILHRSENGWRPKPNLIGVQ
ncbi:MAG: tRNA pseudouridine(55) synthase TruB [Planctomycetia bacterium]|nr:tRNA pseudouridine(55) synthase TruB [Planctomycetia bacterium]